MYHPKKRRSFPAMPPRMRHWKFWVHVIIVVLIVYQSSRIVLLWASQLVTRRSQGAECPRWGSSNITSVYNALPNVSYYRPAPVEKYVLENAQQLGYDRTEPPPWGCNIFLDPSATPFHEELLSFYSQELSLYTRLVQERPDMENDVRSLINRHPENQTGICSQLQVHPRGLSAVFSGSGQLSWTRDAGYSEPLLPPMRHPGICWQPETRNDLMNMNYMVHDFAAMCNGLRPHVSRTVLLDMGASLDFHGDEESPILFLLRLYRKFGIVFDHIYAFEVSSKDPVDVYAQVPDWLMASYHWINVGIHADPESKYNPLYSILDKFTKDDLVIVKLDVDTPCLEVPMAYQVLNDPSLRDKIDHFYFEHHVYLAELAPNWRKSMKGSIQESLKLFHNLRRMGVAAHFWP